MNNNFCSNCGNKIREDFKVCPYCGKKLFVEPKSKFCHLCGSAYNEDGSCPKCSKIVEQIPVIVDSKKLNIFGLLSFVFAIMSVILIMVASELPDGLLSDMLILLFIVLVISGFVLQFFGRKKGTATIWKVFSWIAFGICIFFIIIVFLAVVGALFSEFSYGFVTDF